MHVKKHRQPPKPLQYRAGDWTFCVQAHLDILKIRSPDCTKTIITDRWEVHGIDYKLWKESQKPLPVISPKIVQLFVENLE